MNNKPIKVFFSFGIGRLHFTNLIPELVKKNLGITIIQGWTPKKISPLQIKFMELLLNRKNIGGGLGKRSLLLENVSKGYSINLPEIGQRILWRFFSKGKRRDNIKAFSWKMFGRKSAKYLSKGYDICHIRSGAGHGVILKAKRLSIPVIVDHSIMHPHEIERNLNPVLIKYQIDPEIKESYASWKQVVNDCENADTILVNSNLVKQSLIRCGINNVPIEIAHLGISPNFVAKKTSWTLIKENRLKIIFTGSFGIRKGADDIVMALEILKQKNIHYEFHIFGSVNVPGLLQESMDKLNVIEHGFVPQDDLISHLVNSDVYLFPSLAEGAANSLLEAMAVGLPVITTEYAGADVVNAKNGLLIDIYAPEQIVSAIIKLKEDEVLRKKVGENAIRFIQDTYTWDICSDRINNMYINLITEKANAQQI